LAAIGEITDDRKLQLIDAGKSLPLKPLGWDPF
jgi:hypothetical protein